MLIELIFVFLRVIPFHFTRSQAALVSLVPSLRPRERVTERAGATVWAKSTPRCSTMEGCPTTTLHGRGTWVAEAGVTPVWVAAAEGAEGFCGLNARLC